MKNQVLKALGVLVGVATMLGTGVTDAPAQPAPAGSGVEGEVSPNARAFIDRQTRFGAMRTGPERIDFYAEEIFDEHATLWEAAGSVIQGREAIRAAIAGTLNKLPSFRMHPTRVAVDGNVVMYGAHNEVEVHGTTLSYPAIYRVVLGDDGRVIQGRRYYDRYTWFAELDPGLEDVFDGVRDTAGKVTAPGGRWHDLKARAAAWNGQDAAALVAPTGGVPLTGTGLGDGRLRTPKGKADYLQRLFDKVDSLDLRPGQTVRTGEATYQEWYGTMTTPQRPTPTSFGIIERFDGRHGWTLSFDTLPLIAGPDKVRELYGKL
ncbi:ketosteroid isomerase-like protein [Saccharothrix tamanrassetensis]|uniref:Ketosteroid isomerase-like protein n=1 Tax=Saccharothrix tamanrassetensis TaxID=1051531 RepID=A0A841CWE3_9PSEU|nr:nuclear transport factor 2 family protein [Saccharothrix tamanrassetensis]MBB5960327.1 ketosteroid isomerase-like protein [Saccharothrix tamanrassetensis]